MGLLFPRVFFSDFYHDAVTFVRVSFYPISTPGLDVEFLLWIGPVRMSDDFFHGLVEGRPIALLGIGLSQAEMSHDKVGIKFTGPEKMLLGFTIENFLVKGLIAF